MPVILTRQINTTILSGVAVGDEAGHTWQVKNVQLFTVAVVKEIVAPLWNPFQ